MNRGSVSPGHGQGLLPVAASGRSLGSTVAAPAFWALQRRNAASSLWALVRGVSDRPRGLGTGLLMALLASGAAALLSLPADSPGKALARTSFPADPRGAAPTRISLPANAVPIRISLDPIEPGGASTRISLQADPPGEAPTRISLHPIEPVVPARTSHPADPPGAAPTRISLPADLPGAAPTPIAPSAGRPSARLPAYPGGKAVRIAGSLVLTTSDPLPKVKTGYTSLFRKAGWKEVLPDAVLNGDVPGADKAALNALSRSVTLLSFERDGQVADLFLAPGKDARNRPITWITILTTDTSKGDRSGRP